MLAREVVDSAAEESSTDLLEYARTEARIGVRALYRAPPDDVPQNVEEAASEAVETRIRNAFARGLGEPLSTLATAVAAVRHNDGDARSDRLVEAIGRTDSALHDLIDFVLLNTQGTFRIARRRMDLKLLCERVIDTLQRAHPQHAFVLACGSKVEGDWDPDHVASLLSRLVLNAIERGSPQRVIRVAVQDFGDSAVLDVHNQGPTVDEVDLESLFEPFARSAERPGGCGSLGLGLHLSREIARAHGGRLEAYCDGVAGTTLRVTLPRALE